MIRDKYITIDNKQYFIESYIGRVWDTLSYRVRLVVNNELSKETYILDETLLFDYYGEFSGRDYEILKDI